jgi:hypothetical protein
MARFVDVPLDNGDPNRAVADLIEGAKTSQAPPAQRAEPVNQNQNVDPRFAGKSTEEIVNMYRNLESHSGRLASQLGESKNMLNQLILGKRNDDLRQNGGEPVKVNPTDLMVNPTEALDRYLQPRENAIVSSLQERLNQLESQLGQVNFSTKHRDAESITADPAFANWVRQTPLRMRLAAEAAQDNYGSADLLLTEWNVSKSAGTNQVSAAQQRAQELASGLRLEGGNTGSENGNSPRSAGGKQYRRADLIALRQSNPEKYDELGTEIFKAYKEGRVID